MAVMEKDLEFEQDADEAIAIVKADRVETAGRQWMNEVTDAVVAYGWAMAFGLITAFVLWAKWVTA